MFKKQTDFIRGHAAFKHMLNPFVQVGIVLIVALAVIIGVAIKNAYANTFFTTVSASCTGGIITVSGDLQYFRATAGDPEFASWTVSASAGAHSPGSYSGSTASTPVGGNTTNSIAGTISGAYGGTTYTIQVTANGQTTNGVGAPMTTTATCDGGLSIASATCDLASGSWSNANGAQVLIDVNGGNVGNAIVSGSSWSFSLTGLVSNGDTVSVYAISPPMAPSSTTVSGCAPPLTAPSGNIACTTVSDVQIDVTGTITSNPDTLSVRIYDVTDAAALGGTFTSGSSTESDTGLTASTAYTYRLQYNNGGVWFDISGATDTCTTSAAVNIPTGTIACTLTNPVEMEITATVLTNPDTLQMRVFKAGSGQLGVTFTSGTQNRTDTAVTPDNSYTYRLQYFDGSNWFNLSGVNDTCTSPDLSPSIVLKKYITVTSGTDQLASYAGIQRDAQTAPGEDVTYDSNVEYVITVENDGDTILDIGGLTNDQAGTYKVSDDMCDTAVTFDSGNTTTNVPPSAEELLDVGEIWIYTCTRNNVTTQVTNTADVTANPVLDDGTDLATESDQTDNDPANANPILNAAIVLKKYVTVDSGTDELAGYTGIQVDAQTAPGEVVARGKDVEYVITVENTGDIILDIGGLTNDQGGTYKVSDDMCTTAVTYVSGNTTTNVPPAAEELLDTDETWIYTCTIEDVTAQTTNTADVTANPVEADGTDIGVGSDLTDDDPANVDPNSPDLALIKTTSQATVSPSEDVTFTVTIHNQGDVDAYNIIITDYIPSGTTLAAVSTAWTASPDGTTATTSIAGPLAVGNSVSVDVTLTADAPPWDGSTDPITNYAEISAAEDEFGNALDDIDSTADGDVSNDCGGEANSANDDRLDGDGVPALNCDEDDHDPENIPFLPIAAIDIEKLVGFPDIDEERFDADTEEDRVAVATGADATITIYVANVGHTELTLYDGQPEVDEVCGDLSIYDQGDDDPNDILSVGEVWTYTCLIEDVFEAGNCAASVIGNPVTPDGTDIAVLNDVTDEDPVYLDIGGSLFGATVAGSLEDTGSGAITFVVSGSLIIMSALVVWQFTTGKRVMNHVSVPTQLPQLSTDHFGSLNLGAITDFWSQRRLIDEGSHGEVAQLIAQSGALGISTEYIAPAQQSISKQQNESLSASVEGRNGVLFKV